MGSNADLSPRQVRVLSPAGEANAVLKPTRDADGNWTFTLASDGREWTASGHNCFAGLRELRRVLDESGWLIGLNGARENAVVSGMQADMAEGRSMYLVQIGHRGRPEAVRTLDPAPLDEVVSVEAQDRAKQVWLDSLSSSE